MGVVTLEDVKKCEEVITFLEIADKQLKGLGIQSTHTDMLDLLPPCR